jgi:hypothetical protein
MPLNTIFCGKFRAGHLQNQRSKIVSRHLEDAHFQH